MRLVTLSKSLNLSVQSKKEKVSIIDGVPYIMPDNMAREILQIYGQGILYRDVDFDMFYKKYRGESLNNKSLFCFRSGGIGDLIFMLGGIKNLKAKYPTCKITVGSSPKNLSIFYNNAFIDKTCSIPYPYTIAENADYHLHFENIIEENSLAEKINAYDLFLKAFYLEPKNISTNSKVPEIFINEDNSKKINDFLKSKSVTGDDLVVGYQLVTSSIIRDYPIKHARKLLKILADKKYKVLLLGHGASGYHYIEELGLNDENLIDCTRISEELHDFFALVQNCNAVIGGDSSMLHLAGSFNIPLLGLFGAFDSDLRLKYYKNAVAINGKPICAPCFAHGNLPCRNRTKNDFSACMELIQPEKILEVFEQQIVPLIKYNQSKRIESYSHDKNIHNSQESIGNN